MQSVWIQTYQKIKFFINLFFDDINIFIFPFFFLFFFCSAFPTPLILRMGRVRGRLWSDFKFRPKDDIVYVLNLSQTETSKSIMGRQLQGWVQEFGGIQGEGLENWPFIAKSITLLPFVEKYWGSPWSKIGNKVIQFSRVQMNENNNSHKTSRWFAPMLLLHQNQPTQFHTLNTLFEPMVVRLNGR